MKHLERILFFAGLAAMPVLIAGVGAGETVRLVGGMGSWVLLIVVLGIVPNVLDTVALYLCLPLDRARLGLAYTFAGRLAGEGVNSVLPTATVGGELVKVSLLARRAPLERVVAGVSLTYAIDAFTIMVLAALALPIALPRLALPSKAKLALAALVLAGLVGTYIFLALVRAGLIGRVRNLLHRLGVAPERQLGAPVAPVVSARALGASALLLLGGTLWQAVEVVIVRYALSQEIHVADSLAIAGISAFLDAVFFFVPGQIGTREGGLAGLTALAGLGAPLGMAIGLVRRLDQIAWASIGYVVLAALRRIELRGDHGMAPVPSFSPGV